MNPETVIYLPYFGNGRFAPLLSRVVDQLQGVKTRFPVRVLTDPHTEVSAFPAQRVGVGHQLGRYVRRGHAGEGFDYKAALVMGLLQLRPAHRCIVMDLDNAVRHNFDHVVDAVDAGHIAMPPAPGEPYALPIKHPNWDNPLVEHTSAFMLFPAATMGADMAELFRYYWLRHTPEEHNHVLKEERTWSLVWHFFQSHNRATLLGPEMSWSRFWGDEPRGTLIRHMHGQEKWE